MWPLWESMGKKVSNAFPAPDIKPNDSLVGAKESKGMVRTDGGGE